MFVHFLMAAKRQFLKNKLFSFINIFGLSIGIAVCMLMILYIAHEFSYDKFNKNADRIYALSSRAKIGSDTVDLQSMSFQTGPLIQRSIPLVQSFVRIYSPFSAVTLDDPSHSNVKFKEKRVLFADSNFFHFFSLPLRSGNFQTVLSQPHSLIITERMARKYFGGQNPIGKALRYNRNYIFTITGVADDPPSNSNIVFDFIASIESLLSMEDGERLRNESSQIKYGEFKTFLLLQNSQSKKNVENSIQRICQQHNVSEGKSDRYDLNGLTDLHFNTVFSDTSGSKYLLIFSLVTGVVLLLALVNYMSLATADSSRRSKEVAFRKVLGANSYNIAYQFYVESALYSAVAFILAFAIFLLIENYFFSILECKIDFKFIFKPFILFLFLLLYLASALLAGFYPAMVLSAFKPGSILSTNLTPGGGSIGIRKFFTVLQFTLAISVIIYCITVNRQVHFFRQSDTGVVRENVLMISVDDSAKNHFSAFEQDISSLSGVSKTALANYPMYQGFDVLSGTTTLKDASLPLPILTVNENFISLLGMKWSINPTDSLFFKQENRIVINEVAISKFSLPENPIGSIIKIMNTNDYYVAGVLKNFVFTSLGFKIEAIGLFVKSDTSFDWTSSGDGRLFIKVDQHVNLPRLLGSVKAICSKYNNTTPFSYEFLDEVFDAKYKSEERLENILNLCTPLVIFIACLGLLGLTYFNVTQKAKEISIRKVLGADRKSIAFLIGRNFIGLILLSIIIAFPISWYVADKWLNNFPYRVKLGWITFLFAGVGILLISISTIIAQVFRAADTNPVTTLKN